VFSFVGGALSRPCATSAEEDLCVQARRLTMTGTGHGAANDDRAATADVRIGSRPRLAQGTGRVL
jgi:hypothetical protein